MSDNKKSHQRQGNKLSKKGAVNKAMAYAQFLDGQDITDGNRDTKKERETDRELHASWGKIPNLGINVGSISAEDLLSQHLDADSKFEGPEEDKQQDVDLSRTSSHMSYAEVDRIMNEYKISREQSEPLPKGVTLQPQNGGDVRPEDLGKLQSDTGANPDGKPPIVGIG